MVPRVSRADSCARSSEQGEEFDLVPFAGSVPDSPPFRLRFGTQQPTLGNTRTQKGGEKKNRGIVAFPENSSGSVKFLWKIPVLTEEHTDLVSTVRQITHTQTPSTFPTHSTRAVDFATRQPKPGTSSLKADRLPLSRASPPLRLLSAKSQGERPLAFAKHVHLATASHPAPGRAMIVRWMRAIAAGNL